MSKKSEFNLSYQNQNQNQCIRGGNNLVAYRSKSQIVISLSSFIAHSTPNPSIPVVCLPVSVSHYITFGTTFSYSTVQLKYYLPTYTYLPHTLTT